jgi:hypothetical protein
MRQLEAANSFHAKVPVHLLAAVGLWVLGLGCNQGQDGNQTPNRVPSMITPLTTCREMPPNLSENIRRSFNQICSATTYDQRRQALRDFPFVRLPETSERFRRLELGARLQGAVDIEQAEMVGVLPLLAEIMATDDFSVGEGGRRTYIAEDAAYVTARAGVDAIPYAIKAMQSKKPVEKHAGLVCAREIVRNLETREQTNGLKAVCSKLLPYVSMCSTSDVPEEDIIGVRGFFGRVSDEADKTWHVLVDVLYR